MARKLVAELFHVCVTASGVLAVIVPVLLDSVVKVPVVPLMAAGVVEPMAAGAAKFTRALSKVPVVTSEAAWAWTAAAKSVVAAAAAVPKVGLFKIKASDPEFASVQLDWTLTSAPSATFKIVLTWLADKSSGSPVNAVARPLRVDWAMLDSLVLSTASLAMVAANDPVPLPVTLPVRVIVWSPVLVPVIASSLVLSALLMEPAAPVVAALIEIAGVVPPEDTMGADPVTEVTWAVLETLPSPTSEGVAVAPTVTLPLVSTVTFV